MPRTWAWCSTPSRSGCRPDRPTFPRSRRRSRRSGGRTRTRRRAVDLVHDRPGFVVEVGPSAALEYAALVLVRPAGPLHHSVDGDLRGGRQLHGRGFLLVGWSSVLLLAITRIGDPQIALDEFPFGPEHGRTRVHNLALADPGFMRQLPAPGGRRRILSTPLTCGSTSK